MFGKFCGHVILICCVCVWWVFQEEMTSAKKIKAKQLLSFQRVIDLRNVCIGSHFLLYFKNLRKK